MSDDGRGLGASQKVRNGEIIMRERIYVTDILKDWLKANGYDGLTDGGTCFCGIANLMTCGGTDSCEPWKKDKP